MQLYALLESIDQYISGITSTHIIVRADSNRYKIAYHIVQNKFEWANFVYQDNQPYDFKELVLASAFNNSKSEYVLFAVDDIIVKDYVDLIGCVDLLEKYQTYNLLLRLGKNINYCYSMNIDTPMPVVTEVEKGVYRYKFSSGKGDWAYPNNVDMSVYRKKDIYNNLASSDWTNPNQMEGVWAAKSNLNQNGLFFELSKIINIPLNIVGSFKNNRHMNSYSEIQLLDKFEQGFKINIQYFDKIVNRSAHEEHEIHFR